MDLHYLVTYGLLLLCCMTDKSTSALPTYYMEYVCSEVWPTYTINVGPTYDISSGIIKATKSRTYQSDFKCTVYLEPYSTDYHIMIAIRKIDFRPGCIDTLTVSEYFPYARKEVYCLDYSDDEEWKIFSSAGKVVVNFTTSLSYATTYSGFQMTYTAYRIGLCSSSEYKCANSNCIAKSLRCDGHNHCGDRSDQSSCGLSSGSIFLVAFAVLLVIALAAGCTVYARNKRSVSTRTAIHPPPQQPYYPIGYPTTYQGNYPQENYPPLLGNRPPPPPVYMNSPVQVKHQ